MKIVFANDVIYAYASGAAAVGGAERQQWLLARVLAAIGWSVTVGVREPLEREQRVTIEGVEFVGIGKGEIHSAWYRFLVSQKPDWWYWRCATHLWGSAVEIARLVGVRTIFAAGFDTDVQPRRALCRRSRWWSVYAWGLSRTDRIFVQHTGQLSALKPKWRSKAHIVPSIARRAAAIRPHSERADYVAWVAMLRQPKRPDLLIEIARRTPAVRYLVCGGPTLFFSPAERSERLVEAMRAQPNIEFLGRVAPERAQHIIANAAVLLSTSDAEGFPNTFLEAWSSGTPVVSLTIDPDGIIEQHRLGTVAGTVDRAAEDIIGLVRSPRRRDDIAARGYRYVAVAHSEAAVAEIVERAVAGTRSS